MVAPVVRRLPILLAGLVAVLVAASTGVPTTAGGFAAQVTNSGSRAGSGSLIHTHTYGSTTCTSLPVGGMGAGSTIACPGSLLPAAVPSSGTASANDAIAYQGTIPAAAVRETVGAASCGPVQLANRLDGSRPLLARYGTAFSPSVGPMPGSGSITLDGVAAYEASVMAEVQPTPILGATYGIGIAFKTTSTAGGALVSYSDSPIDGTGGSNDRILYLDRAGRLGFGYNTSGGNLGTTSAAYNDGGWHFAYVKVSMLLFGLLTTISIQVDGASAPALSSTGLFSMSGYSGYWHAGWGALSKYGYGAGLSNRFAGSLSNFVVLNGGSAPATLGFSSSQAAFNASLGGSVTAHWLLNDPGTTTFGGPYPVIGATSPCSMVTFGWAFTNPVSCAWSPPSATAACTTPPSTLSGFVAAGPQTIGAPPPGTTQTGTISVGRAGTYNVGFVPGLRLYVPLTFGAAAGSWRDAFAWSSAASALVA